MGKSFLLRDVLQSECPWLDRDLAKGETVFRYPIYRELRPDERDASVSYRLNGPAFKLPLDALSVPIESLYLRPQFYHCAEETLRAIAAACPDDYYGITSYMLAPHVFVHGRRMSNTDPVFQPTLRWLQRHRYVECRNRSTWHLTQKGRNYVAAYPAAREAA